MDEFIKCYDINIKRSDSRKFYPNDDFDIDVLLSDSALYKDDLYNLLTQLYSSTSDWARDYIQIHPKQHKQYVDMVNTGNLNLKDISLKYGI